jgi:hypothetical protein
MKSHALLLPFLGLSLLLAPGCGGPKLSEADIGQPVFELPKLPGSDKPFPMPELDTATEVTDGKADIVGPAAPSKAPVKSSPTQPPGEQSPSGQPAPPVPVAPTP